MSDKDKDKVVIPEGMGPNDPEDPEEPEEPEEPEGFEEEEMFLSDCPLCGAEAVMDKPGEDEHEVEGLVCCRCDEEWVDSASYRAALKADYAKKIDFAKIKNYALRNALGFFSCLRELWNTEPAKKLRQLYNNLPKQ